MSFHRRFYAGSVTPDDTGFWVNIDNVINAPDDVVGVSQCHSTPHAVESATLSNFGVSFGGSVLITGVAFGARWASNDPCTVDRGCFQLDDGSGAYNPIGGISLPLSAALADYTFGGDRVLLQQLANPAIETVYDQAYWEAGAYTLTVTARCAALLQHASLDAAWIDLYYYPTGDDDSMDNHRAAKMGGWKIIGGEIVTVGVNTSLFPNAPTGTKMALLTVRDNPIRVMGNGTNPDLATGKGSDYSPGARPYEFPFNTPNLKGKFFASGIGGNATCWAEYWGF